MKKAIQRALDAASDMRYMQDKTLIKLINDETVVRALRAKRVSSERLVETALRLLHPRLGICSNPKCKNRTKLYNWKTIKFANYCSSKCNLSDPARMDKVRETCERRYGVSNVSQLDEVKASKVETCLQHHGVAHPQQSAKVRAKTEEIVMQRYGVCNVSKAADVQRKRTATFLKRFGVDNPRKAEKVKERIRKSWVRNYGVDHPMKSHDVVKRLMLSRNHNPYHTKRNKKITISGKEFHCFGYEPLALTWLHAIGIPVSEISTHKVPPVEYYCSKKKKMRLYFPDFKVRINGETVYVEVKSTATLLGHNSRATYRNVRDKAIGVHETGRKLLTLVFEHERSTEPALKTFRIHEKSFKQVVHQLKASGKSRYVRRDVLNDK